MQNKLNIETNPEFASEIILSIPYVYWLHEQNLLNKVSICKGMKPFYWFCDNVEEKFSYRTLDNAVALKDIPNKWLHNSEAGNGRPGVIDYSQWKVPPYTKHYSNDHFEKLKPYVVVNNIFNMEGGYNPPARYFDIQQLYDIFNYLIDTGYNVIYKRPDNTEFIPDQNEINTMHQQLDIQADVEGLGRITDLQLVEMMDNVYNINELNYNNWDYSTLNLKVFAETDGFISVNGGGYQLCACFDKPMVIYTTKGKEMRPKYLEYDNSYINMVRSKNTEFGTSNKVKPVYDNYENWPSQGRDYKTLMNTVKDTFIGHVAESMLRTI